MKPDLARIRESKRVFRKELAERPIAEKLRMLDALRQRTLAIRRASNSDATKKAIVQETPPLPDNQSADGRIRRPNNH